MGSLAAPAPQRAHACLCGLQGERFEPGMPAVRGKTVRWPRTAGWRAAGKLACPCLGEEAGRQAQATAFGAECAPAGLRPRLISAGKGRSLCRRGALPEDTQKQANSKGAPCRTAKKKRPLPPHPGWTGAGPTLDWGLASAELAGGALSARLRWAKGAGGRLRLSPVLHALHASFLPQRRREVSVSARVPHRYALPACRRASWAGPWMPASSAWTSTIPAALPRTGTGMWTTDPTAEALAWSCRRLR